MGRTESVSKAQKRDDEVIECEALASVHPLTGEQAFKRFYEWYRDTREGSEKEFRENAEPLVERLLESTNGFTNLNTEAFQQNPGLMWPARLAYLGMSSGRLARNRFAGHVITEADSDPKQHSQYEYMVERMENNNKIPEYDNAEAMLFDFLKAHDENQGVDTETVQCNPDALQELAEAKKERDEIDQKIDSVNKKHKTLKEKREEIKGMEIDSEEKLERLDDIDGQMDDVESRRETLREEKRGITEKIDELQDEKTHLKEVKRMLVEHMVDEKMDTKMRMSGDQYQEDELTAMLDDDYEYEQLDNSEIDTLNDSDFKPGTYLVHKTVDLGDANHNIDYIINARNYHKPLFIEAKKAGRYSTAGDQCEKIQKVHQRLKKQHSGDFLYVANLMGFFGKEHVERLRRDGIDVFYEHDKGRALDPVLQLMACLFVSGML